MKNFSLLMLCLCFILASCSVHMQVPGKHGKHPKGKVIITVPSDKPDVKPIPKSYFPHIH